MKKIFLVGQMILLSAVIFGQTEIKNAENFTEGMILIFQHCESDNISVGQSGKNKTWDFSLLIKKEGEQLTEEMIAPDETDLKSEFPDANLVEKHSDGRLVFMKKMTTENYLVGFVDTESGLKINYLKPMIFAKRPLKYGDKYGGEYEVEYSTRGMDFKGKGTISIVADGYGTLILPNGKYENVLRVKITQIQTDKLIQYQSESTTETISYVWFDNEHTSALLKIDETKSAYYNSKSVQFLLEESVITK